MQVLRTPDERFRDLADWDLEPRYRTIVADDGLELRFHFVDEGPRDAAGRAHVMIEDANHFIQEDAPEELVRIIDEFVRTGS